MSRPCPRCLLPRAECICEDEDQDERPAAFAVPFREPGSDDAA